jgi:hypothetical protein
VQLTDRLPSGVAYVAGSCSGTCTVSGSDVIWDLGPVAKGASGSRTLQVRIPANAASGTAYADEAIIRSAQYDLNSIDNNASLNTTLNAKQGSSLSVSAASGTYGGNTNLSATLTSGGSRLANQTVTFTLGGSSVGPATTNASGVATLSNASLAGINAGTYSGGGASFSGDTNYSSSNGTAGRTVAKADQTITFAAGTPTTKNVGDQDFQVNATSTSGLPVTLASSTTGVCTVSGGTVHIVSTGVCTITASQAGNANYNAATDVTRSFTIGGAQAQVTLGNLNQTYDGTSKAATASTTPTGLNVTFEYKQNGVAVTPKDAGSYDVVATINDNKYQGSASGTLVIAKATPQVAINWSDSTYDGTANAASATVSGVGSPAESLGPASSLTYYSGSSASGTPLAGAPKDAGTYTVKADFNGNFNYNQAFATKAITKAATTTTVTCNAGPFTYDGTAKTPCSAEVTGPGGLKQAVTPVSYTNNTGAGTATASASYAETANYKSSSGTKDFTIGKAKPSVTITWSDSTYDGNSNAASAKVRSCFQIG